MPKALRTPASVLEALMEEYQLNPFSLSKKVGLSASTVRQITIGKTGITVSTALRLARFFGQQPSFWLEVQQQMEMEMAADDKELQRALKDISKIGKPKALPKGKAQGKPAKKTTLADKRKTAAKVPGSKHTARKPAVKRGGRK